MQSRRSHRAHSRRSETAGVPNKHGEYSVVDLGSENVSTRELAERIAKNENVQLASSIILITYADGSVRPLGCLLFDVLTTESEIADMVSRGLWAVIDRARAECRGPGGSVL